ncbi:MAG: 2-amino-4-hydroxy-6-hydroxymethyldihydropteridine diphosphokinase [Synergistaceae bacterium]|nr:2-amino-4-hydroxy-6-hydroxymethyldihydropteridine diphosphokinase [Synergistaceae bacterium]
MSAFHYNVAFGLGSNLEGRLHNLREAAEKLAYYGFIIEKKSNVFETEPWGVADQPSFLNACVRTRIDKNLSPVKILKIIKKIESVMGRKKSFRYGPRIIDIDLLLIDYMVYENSFLAIPHKEIFNRAFVLYPLSEIFPHWTHPITGEKVSKTALKYPCPVRVVKL